MSQLSRDFGGKGGRGLQPPGPQPQAVLAGGLLLNTE